MAEKINPSGRLLSLDTLRGMDMLFIMGFSGLLVSLCSLFPGGAECAIARNMSHVKWHGLHLMDVVFPLFLFIAGVTFPLSYSKKLSRGVSQGRIWWEVIRRGFVLAFLGLVYNGLLQFKPDLRFASVLGRIGMAWMLAAMLFMCVKTKGRVLIASLLLAGYWLLLRFVHAPDAPAGAGPYSFEGNLAGYVDRILLPGRLYMKTFDPEGILGLIPATVTAMLGMFTGEFVKRDDLSGGRKTLCMLFAAAALLAGGLLWGRVFPINKSLWTSSFVLVVGAISLCSFALLYYVVDVRGWSRWTLPFRVIGLNSITIYLGQQIIGFRRIAKFFVGGVAGLCPELWGAVVIDLGYVVVCWLFLYFLYRHKVFLRV